MAISGAAVIKGNVIRREGNKISRSLPLLALPDVLFKKPTVVCNLVTDIYADICCNHSTSIAVEVMTASNLLHLSLLFRTICMHVSSLFLRVHWKILMACYG